MNPRTVDTIPNQKGIGMDDDPEQGPRQAGLFTFIIMTVVALVGILAYRYLLGGSFF